MSPEVLSNSKMPEGLWCDGKQGSVPLSSSVGEHACTHLNQVVSYSVPN